METITDSKNYTLFTNNDNQHQKAISYYNRFGTSSESRHLGYRTEIELLFWMDFRLPNVEWNLIRYLKSSLFYTDLLN